MVDGPPEWLEEWGRQVGAKLEDGLREGPSFIAFARENGSVYHTYTVKAPDPFVAPYHSFLLKRTPRPQPPSRAPGARTNTRSDGMRSAVAADQRLALDSFRATAARTSAFNAFSSIFSPSWKSMARLVFPSRLELKRPDGSSSAAPLAKVIFTTLL